MYVHVSGVVLYETYEIYNLSSKIVLLLCTKVCNCSCMSERLKCVEYAGDLGRWEQCTLAKIIQGYLSH